MGMGLGLRFGLGNSSGSSGSGGTPSSLQFRGTGNLTVNCVKTYKRSALFNGMGDMQALRTVPPLMFSGAGGFDAVPASGFLPTDITNLTEWWDASDETTITEAVGVSEWAGKTASYSLSNNVGAQQPSYNGTDTISFDGNLKSLFNASVPHNTSDLHVFMVGTIASSQTASNSARVMTHLDHNDDYNSDGKIIIFNVDAPSGDVIAYANKTLGQVAGITDDNVHILHSSVVAGTHSMFKDGVVGTNTMAMNSLPIVNTGIYIGGRPVIPNEFAAMDVNEIIYVIGTMTSQETADTEAYLQAKWSTPALP